MLLASAFFPFARSTERIEGERQREVKARRESRGVGHRWELGSGWRCFLVESRRGQRQEDNLGLVHARAREAEQRRKKGEEAEHCDSARLRRGWSMSAGRQRFWPRWSQAESELRRGDSGRGELGSDSDHFDFFFACSSSMGRSAAATMAGFYSHGRSVLPQNISGDCCSCSSVRTQGDNA